MQKSHTSKKVGEPFSKPEDELHLISMTEDLDTKFSPEKKNNNKWEIQPWLDEQESPSHSPERRVYVARPAPPISRHDRPQLQPKNSLRENSKKVLQTNNNCNFTIRVRNSNPRSERGSFMGLQPVQCENARPATTRRFSTVRRNSFKQRPGRELNSNEQYQEDQQKIPLKEPVNMIVYPMLNQGRKKRLFRKMEKFTNFVSVSLRK